MGTWSRGPCQYPSTTRARSSTPSFTLGHVTSTIVCPVPKPHPSRSHGTGEPPGRGSGLGPPARRTDLASGPPWAPPGHHLRSAPELPTRRPGDSGNLLSWPLPRTQTPRAGPPCAPRPKSKPTSCRVTPQHLQVRRSGGSDRGVSPQRLPMASCVRPTPPTRWERAASGNPWTPSAPPWAEITGDHGHEGD